MDTNTKKAEEAVRQNIISLFQIEKLPEEKREEMINKIGKIIFQSVLIRILPLLPEEDLAEYDKLIESGASPDILLDFFYDKIPGFLGIVAEETENFRRESGEVLERIG